MKRVKFLFLSASLLFIVTAQAQTVDEIINKYVEAIGGKEKISQVKSIYIENSLEAMGNTSPSIESLLQGKGYRNESEFNGMKIVNCYTDKGGWAINPFTGSADAQAIPDEVYNSGKDLIYFGGSMVDYATKGNKVELTGKEGTNYKIKVTKSGGTETSYLIDASTYLITKSLAKGDFGGQSIEITTTFSDYKKTDFGIVLPYTHSTDFGGFVLNYKVTKVEVNKDLDPKIFEMPK
ncbi:MAG: hypothetical protein ACHQFX_00345 [Chitinophagales bacterium]